MKLSIKSKKTYRATAVPTTHKSFKGLKFTHEGFVSVLLDGKHKNESNVVGFINKVYERRKDALCQALDWQKVSDDNYVGVTYC